MSLRAALLLLPAVLLLACQSPSHGQTTPSPEQTQPSVGTSVSRVGSSAQTSGGPLP